MSRWSNEELISAFQLGKEEMLKAWYDQEKQTFISMCRKIGLKQTNDILDIYQESMAILYVKIKDGSLSTVRESMHSYLMAIGKYKAIDYLKKEKRKGEAIDRIEVSALVADVVKETSLDTKKLQMKKSISELGKKCREVILLYYYEGLTISEIRNYMGYKDDNTVKSHKSRCVKSLRQKIGAHG